MAATVYVKTVSDGRRLEVIDGLIYLGGQVEADSLVELIEHPNRQAIARAVVGATHIAGRVPLRHDEAAIAQGALDQARRKFSTDPVALNERFRKVIWAKAAAEGVE